MVRVDSTVKHFGIRWVVVEGHSDVFLLVEIGAAAIDELTTSTNNKLYAAHCVQSVDLMMPGRR